MINTSTNKGFSAVELLITLFIGAVFLLAGYQLFNFSFKTGIEADEMGQASTAAYMYLRQYSSSATNPCSVNTPFNGTPTSSIGTLNNVTITVAISCPFGAVNLSLVTVAVKYDSPQKEVDHALYVSN